MKQLNRWIAMGLLMLGVVFVVWGCAPYQKEEESPRTQAFESGEAEGAGKKGPKIGVSIYRYDDEFMRLYRLELKQYLEETYQAEVVMRNAGGDQEEQNRQMEQFIAEGCDGIIINPVEVQAAGRLADSASQAGIPLVFINREPGEEEQSRWKERKMAVSSVGTDSRQAGTYQGELLLEAPKKGDLNEDGTVSYAMLMGEEGNEDSRYRTEYSIKALEAGGMETEELFSGSGQWDQEKGEKLAKTALDTYGSRLEVIISNNDAMANGALKAAEEAGRIPGKDILLVGIDGLRDTVEYIKEGKMTGTVLNDHEGQARTASDILIKMLGGEEVDTAYLVDYIKITGISTFQNLEGEE
ncbi:MAG: galactose ABC transporter substrate-binding protein [Lacrimispora sp.]|uniref:galactose ABC transporter substrate-binding protein n=1 Tax=Lacrimispora sp. TaxID=2719234 RepID=UPI0039E437C6